MSVSETRLPNALVKVRRLTKAFGTNQVLMGVDLDVQKGSVVSIIGASGSGQAGRKTSGQLRVENRQARQQ